MTKQFQQKTVLPENSHSDFNGNGISDIIWRGKTNDIVGLWEGGQANQWQQLGTASNEWEIQLA